jgi:ABC-2 type transport system ATP-binding protein
MDELVKVCEFQKNYGERKVVNDLSFQVKEGEIIGFLGPNGAGKSTTIRMLTGTEKCDGGDLFYRGKRLNTSRDELKKELGLVPQDIAVYGDLSAYDNVKFFCSLYGYKGRVLESKVKEALEFVALWDRRKEKPGQFSGGMKRRLNIACSIAHSPKLLILDEPTVGIDPQSRNYILEAIRTLNKSGTTVIYVSHYMEEIEALCDRIMILDEGQLKINEEKEVLKEQYKNEGCESLEDIFLKITGTALRDGEE